MIWNQLLFYRHLESDEKLLFVVHRHWFLLIKTSFKTAVFGFLIPAILTWFFPGFFWFAIMWCGVFWTYYVYHLADWYFDAWLATTTSLIKVEWRGLFHHLSSRIPYSEVKEMSSEVHGILGTIFRYGHASISTSAGSRVEMRNVSHPQRVELMIMDIRSSFLAEQSILQKDALQALLSDLVLTHINERGIRFRRT